MGWPSAAMVMHLYVHRRRCFYWTPIVGAVWLPFGDVIAAPYWMAVAGFLLAVFVKPKSYTSNLFFFLIPPTIYYWNVYSEVSHPNLAYFVLVLLLVATCWEKGWLTQGSKAPTSAPGLMSGNINNPQPTTEKPTEKTQFSAFWLELHALSAQPKLPELLQKELDELIGYAELILGCMQNDPQDVKPGSAFLERYLPQVGKVVKRGLVLSAQAQLHGGLPEVEKNCLQALQALRSAFAQQHLRLLENDTLEFETDLSVLNSLLKTDGFKQ